MNAKLWFSLLVLLAGGEAFAGKAALQLPIVTGYQTDGCVNKGARLAVRGMNFGRDQDRRKIVMTADGRNVEVMPVLWTDTQVTVEVPDDPRITAGRSYQIAFQDWSGNSLGNLGPLFKICEAAAAPAETPAVSPAVDDGGQRAKALAAAVFQASGGANWARVRSIHFTFNVEQDGKRLLWARHEWDVRAGTDTVSWGTGQTVTVEGKEVPLIDGRGVVNVWNPFPSLMEKPAYQRWVNDSYWLLMPLKLRDPGVNLAYQGIQEIGGKKYEVLRLSFGSVGLTSGDQYNLYIDPATHLVGRWDYLPSPEKKTSGTWEGYRDFGGLKLSTEHRFGDKRIWLDVGVQTKEWRPEVSVDTSATTSH